MRSHSKSIVKSVGLFKFATLVFILIIEVFIFCYAIIKILKNYLDGNPEHEEWFEVITFFISFVVTLIFSVIALRESSKQTKDINHQREQLEGVTNHLKVISQALPTVYIGKFPDHLPKIIDLIKPLPKGLCIMVDCVDYGSFSAPDLHEKLLQSIKDARTIPNQVKIQILLCGEMQAITRNSPYYDIKYESLIKDPKFVICLDNYLANHPEFQRPENHPQFEEMLDAYQKTVGKQLHDEGVEIKKLQISGEENYPGIFFWVEDNENAVFLLSHVGVEAQEIAFRTRDANLIGIFSKTFETHWDKAEKIESSHWK